MVWRLWLFNDGGRGVLFVRFILLFPSCLVSSVWWQMYVVNCF